MRTLMHVQEFLKKDPLQRLTEKYGIVVSDYPDRIVLNYDQIESDKHKRSPIVMECRGLILGKSDYRVLCRPFERFFNLHEDARNKNFPIEKAVCFEKVDGSLVNVYHDDVKWCAATRKMAFAEGSTRMGRTFLSVFEKALGRSVQEFCTHKVFNPECTYSFELVSPETRVVKPYAQVDIYLLAIRNRKTGKDLSLADVQMCAENFSIKQPKRYYFNSLDGIVEAAKDLPAMDEGYVAYVEDLQWRVKIKNPAYLAIAHLRTNGVLSLPRIIQLVMSGDEQEYLSYFPEDRELFVPYIEAFDYLKVYVNDLWQRTRTIQNQKQFAAAVTGKGQSVLFDLRKGQTLQQILDGITSQARERLMLAFLHDLTVYKLLNILNYVKEQHA